MSQFNDDILEGDGMTLKGISGGGGAPKKRTPRPIKPPGVYVNGKATSKSERAMMDQNSPSSFSEKDVPPPPPPIRTDTSQVAKKHNDSLKMSPEQLAAFEEMISIGSSKEFRAYSDYSMNIREKLEMDLNAVLDMLDKSSHEANQLTIDSQNITSDNTESTYQDNDGLSDRDFIALLEDRNQQVENQLTVVWDELMIKDEAIKQLHLSLDTTNKELTESQHKATQEISQNTAKLNMYKSQVTELHNELEKAKIETGSLHEQVDALRQKLSMEEASKKSLKSQLEKAHAEIKKKDSEARDRGELRNDMKRAMKLRTLTGTISLFAWYMQVRSLALQLAEAKANGGSSAIGAGSVSVSSFSDAVTPLPTSAIMLSSKMSSLNDSQMEVDIWSGKDEIRSYLESVGGKEGGRGPESKKMEEVCDKLDSIVSRERSQRELNAHLLSTIASLKGTIQVYCRIRPHSEKERIQDGKKSESDIKNLSPGSVGRGVQALGVAEAGVYDTYNQSWRGFPFDRVWGPETSQVDLFLEIEPLALSVVDGEPCCIMAYGQTGSGKTYTMHGDGDKNLGISYRTMHKIFTLLELHRSKHAKNGNTFEARVQVSIMEVYNDEVHDLLAQSSGSRRPSAGSGQPLEVRSANGSSEPTVVGLSWHSTPTLQDAINLFDLGCNARATSATTLNHSSSRSHMVMMIEVTTVLNHGTPKSAKLHLVDLAGSERVKQSEATGQALKEAQHINKSLSALGDVMEALDNKASFVPYRNSKLTLLLQGCLGGGPSRTAMVVTCCPTKSTAEESSYTLQFGSRCRRIATSTSNSPPASQVRNLEEALKATRNELKALTSKDSSNKTSAGSDSDALVKRLESEKAELVAALSSLRKELGRSRHAHRSSDNENHPPPPPPPPMTHQPVASPLGSASSLSTSKFSSARISRDRAIRPPSSPSHGSKERTQYVRSSDSSHHSNPSPVPSSPLSSGPSTRPSSSNGVPSYTASVASIKAEGASRDRKHSLTKKPIEVDDHEYEGGGAQVQSSSSIRSFMRMRQTRSKDNLVDGSGDSPNKGVSSLDRSLRKPPPPVKGRDLLSGGGLGRRTTSPASESAAEKYGFLGGGSTPRSARTSSDSVRQSSASRSNSANRFFGKLDVGSNPLRSGSGTPRNVRTNSSERLDPSPASRRAEAAKKHAARMQAVRASSGKGRWGNSI